jgi:hypothetical protein
MRRSTGLFCSAAVLLFATTASADVGYVFDVTTFYQFGNPAGGTLNNTRTPAFLQFKITAPLLSQELWVTRRYQTFAVI